MIVSRSPYSKSGMRARALLLTSLLAVAQALCAGRARAACDATAAIDIDTHSTVRLERGYSGVNDFAGFPVEYWDHRFNELAETVHYGWIRFPGGTDSDIYDWRTGEERQDWFDQFSGYAVGPGADLVEDVFGKGGARLIEAAERARELGCSLIVCANAFTDTPESIGEMAAYARANHIPVLAWELANEPYFFKGFFANSTAYLDRMKCFRDKIKAADPDAVVAIFARDPGNSNFNNGWDAGIAAYPDKYWDEVTFHYYPPFSSGGIDQWMADECGVLAMRSTSLVTDHLETLSPPGTKILLTEFDASLPVEHSTGAASVTDGTLWGGIYVAEFIMRMSTLPSVAHVGPHSIVNVSGVQSTKNNYAAVQKAAMLGVPIDTTKLDFGFYIEAQANALSVLNRVVNHAERSNATTVTGGVTVPATGTPDGRTPALYAMSYTSEDRKLAVVITNKSGTPHLVHIRVNGARSYGPFPAEFVSSSLPGAKNSPTDPFAVTVQHAWFYNEVTVPPYSVIHVDIHRDRDND